MKAIVSKTDLRDAIARIMPAVAVKPATPVLAGIYLQADAHSSLTLRATNFELDITAKIPANVEAEGKVVAAANSAAKLSLSLTPITSWQSVPKPPALTF